LQKEKEEYFKQIGSNVSTSEAKSNWQSHALSTVSKFSNDPNSYMFEGDTKKRIDEINNKLLQKNPGAQDAMSHMSSALTSTLTKENMMSHSIAKMSDTDSHFSMPISGISRRSNFTMISLASQAGKPGDNRLPKE